MIDYQKDKEKFLTTQIMNYLFTEWPNIDLFSTNDLERIIAFCNFNRAATINLLESYSQETIMKMIEEYNIKQTVKRNHNQYAIATNVKISKKENFYVQMTKNNPNDLTKEQVWDFISKNVNVVDMRELLNSYDHMKLINKAKKETKGADSKKFSEYFEKFYENREKKYTELFKACLEDNDIQFLINTQEYENHFKNKKKKENFGKIDPAAFYGLFTSSSEYVKSNVLDFLDIFTVGRLGLVNKILNNYVYKRYDLENVAKKYCVSIFKNTNIYVNDKSTINTLYKNYFSMIKNRPRVMYSGLYFAKAKFNKVGDTSGLTEFVSCTVTTYRFYRFFPNGAVYTITTPFTKSQKLLAEINKGNLEIRRGSYYVDCDDTLIIEIKVAPEESYVYRYKVKIRFLILDKLNARVP
jgi:hypothetical protein